jgi:DNA-binding transcriptional LysR family regulator
MRHGNRSRLCAYRGIYPQGCAVLPNSTLGYMSFDPWRLRLLDVFERVGTVRGVAAELLLSPSTVSQQFGVLEAETGAQLFERAGRNIRLTPTGRMLVERARDLRDLSDSIEAELRDVTGGVAGVLRLGGFASSIEPLLIETVARLRMTHPDLTVELQEIEPRESTTALDRGICDIVLTVDENDGSLLLPSLTVVPLATDPLLVVMPEGHPLAVLDTVPLANLADEPWALDLPGTYMGELVLRQCRLDGFEPMVAGRFSSYPVLLAHVAAGLSVGVLPGLAATLRPGVVRRPTVGLADRSIVIAVRRANSARPAVVAAIDMLRDVAAAFSGFAFDPDAAAEPASRVRLADFGTSR